jgi:hypothetical protein
MFSLKFHAPHFTSVAALANTSHSSLDIAQNVAHNALASNNSLRVNLLSIDSNSVLALPTSLNGAIQDTCLHNQVLPLGIHHISCELGQYRYS